MEKSTDLPSFDRIADELKEPLLRYLLRFVGERAIAQDLLQETLIRISRGLVGFEGRSSLKSWAFSIATRVATDYFRKPHNRIRIVEMDEAQHLADPELLVDARLVIDEMNACVRQVIDSLPEDYRAALVLHDLEGLTAAEIAAICGTSLPTAKIRVHRARVRLKAALQDACQFYRDDDNPVRPERGLILF